MAETFGSLIDKITINELKCYHMKLEIERADASDAHCDACKNKLEILTEQRDDLVEEMNHMFIEIQSGKQAYKIYRQFKMYNDPKYLRERVKSE